MCFIDDNICCITFETFNNIKKLENVGMIPIGAGICAKRLREHRLKTTNEHIEEVTTKFESACKTIASIALLDVKREIHWM